MKGHYNVQIVSLTVMFSLRVQTSTFPVPCVCGEDEIADWFQSLAGCLHWNVRERQHSLNFSQHSSTESGLSNGTDHSAHKVP